MLQRRRVGSVHQQNCSPMTRRPEGAVVCPVAPGMCSRMHRAVCTALCGSHAELEILNRTKPLSRREGRGQCTCIPRHGYPLFTFFLFSTLRAARAVPWLLLPATDRLGLVGTTAPTSERAAAEGGCQL